MTDYAIHSPNDGELLIKFHDELVKKGIETDSKWNEQFNPRIGQNYLFIPKSGEGICFFEIELTDPDETVRTLTPENFNTVLNEVLQNFGIEYKEQSIDSDNMRAAEVKEFEIWVEGYATTGERGSARMIGKGIGSTFDEAVKDYMKKNHKHGIEENKKDRYINDDYYQNRRSNWNIWACNLFDNETDARKLFG